MFVEDTAIVLDEVAVMMSMGAASRRGEPAGIEPALREVSADRARQLPATIDGGDVVRVGRARCTSALAAHERGGDRRAARRRAAVRLQRHRRAGARLPASQDRLQRAARRPLSRQLELDRRVAAAGRFVVQVPENEPWAGDVLVIDRSDHRVRRVPGRPLLRGSGGECSGQRSEFAKAEGGVTC